MWKRRRGRGRRKRWYHTTFGHGTWLVNFKESSSLPIEGPANTHIIQDIQEGFMITQEEHT